MTGYSHHECNQETETIQVRCARIEEGNERPLEDVVPVEDAVTVLLNGEPIADVTVSPGNLKEFAVGYLIYLGAIASAEDIDEITAGGGSVDITCPHIQRGAIRETIPGRDPGTPETAPMIRKVDSRLRVTVHDISRAIGQVTESNVHRLTGGVHTCGLFRPSGSRDLAAASICSDVGRHNAMDKVIGAAVLQGCRLGSCFAAATGRASSDMVFKCRMAGIPLLASRGATTSLAIRISRESGITLIAFARPNRMNIYCNRERVIADDGLRG